MIDAVATVHTAPARWDTLTSEATAAWRVQTALTALTPDWITRPDAWRRVLYLTAQAHGPAQVPLGHLDLKTDHARRQPDGRLAIMTPRHCAPT